LLQFDVLTTLSLTILAYLHSFSCCCVRNLRNPAKFAENSNLCSSRSSKVIDLDVNRKPMYDFLLVTNSNFVRICYRFRDIDNTGLEVLMGRWRWNPCPCTVSPCQHPLGLVYIKCKYMLMSHVHAYALHVLQSCQVQHHPAAWEVHQQAVSSPCLQQWPRFHVQPSGIEILYQCGKKCLHVPGRN